MFAEDNGCRRQWFNDPMGQRVVKITKLSVIRSNNLDEDSHGVRGWCPCLSSKNWT